MKKKTINILMLLAVMATAFQMTSCSDDDFTATIFDTNDYPLDRNLLHVPAGYLREGQLPGALQYALRL